MPFPNFTASKKFRHYEQRKDNIDGLRFSKFVRSSVVVETQTCSWNDNIYIYIYIFYMHTTFLRTELFTFFLSRLPQDVAFSIGLSIIAKNNTRRYNAIKTKTVPKWKKKDLLVRYLPLCLFLSSPLNWVAYPIKHLAILEPENPHVDVSLLNKRNLRIQELWNWDNIQPSISLPVRVRQFASFLKWPEQKFHSKK